ncbi:MAG: PRC-barrel domain-containing protein [Armatimonadetes bacterium]|nr:PRC-barrel domain-containing protein [Armatimonadota bacterium]
MKMDYLDEEERQRERGDTAGDPEVRGWDVYDADRHRIGRVEGLVANPEAPEIRFLLCGLESGKRVLVPLYYADLDPRERRVFVVANRHFVESAVEWREGQEVDWDAAYARWERRTYDIAKDREEAGVAGGEAPPLTEEERHVLGIGG